MIEKVQLDGRDVSPVGKTVNLDMSAYKTEAITTEEIDQILAS